jgi:hypothetical protein
MFQLGDRVRCVAVGPDQGLSGQIVALVPNSLDMYKVVWDCFPKSEMLEYEEDLELLS